MSFNLILDLFTPAIISSRTPVLGASKKLLSILFKVWNFFIALNCEIELTPALRIFLLELTILLVKDIKIKSSFNFVNFKLFFLNIGPIIIFTPSSYSSCDISRVLSGLFWLSFDYKYSIIVNIIYC